MNVMGCPPAPTCMRPIVSCEPPMVLITPLDSAGCRIGCDYCDITDVPEIPSFDSCGVAIERCVEDSPGCTRVYPCNNNDEIVLAYYPYIPCKDNCVNVTLTEPEPEPEICENIQSAQIIQTRDGNFKLTGSYYHCDNVDDFENVETLEMISQEELPCAKNWYTSGDLVCYCPCEEQLSTSPPPDIDISTCPTFTCTQLDCEVIQQPTYDDNGCATGCPVCDDTLPSTCNLVELCNEEKDNCISVLPCGEKDDTVMVQLCETSDCIISSETELPIKPCMTDRCVAIESLDLDYVCPDAPMCTMEMLLCEGVYTPTDENGCIIGCPTCPNDSSPPYINNIADMCKELVDQYGIRIIENIKQEIPSDKLCESIGLCNQDTDTTECTICTSVVDYAEELIQTNATTTQIINDVKKSCDILNINDEGHTDCPPPPECMPPQHGWSCDNYYTPMDENGCITGCPICPPKPPRDDRKSPSPPPPRDDRKSPSPPPRLLGTPASPSPPPPRGDKPDCNDQMVVCPQIALRCSNGAAIVDYNADGCQISCPYCPVKPEPIDIDIVSPPTDINKKDIIAHIRRRAEKWSKDPVKIRELTMDREKFVKIMDDLSVSVAKVNFTDDIEHNEVIKVDVIYSKYSFRTIEDENGHCNERPYVTRCIVKLPPTMGRKMLTEMSYNLYNYNVSIEGTNSSIVADTVITATNTATIIGSMNMSVVSDQVLFEGADEAEIDEFNSLSFNEEDFIDDGIFALNSNTMGGEIVTDEYMQTPPIIYLESPTLAPPPEDDNSTPDRKPYYIAGSFMLVFVAGMTVYIVTRKSGEWKAPSDKETLFQNTNPLMSHEQSSKQPTVFSTNPLHDDV